MRVLEKQLRDDVINRCIEFLDIALNHILYNEQIYSPDTFEKRSKYNLIVYECQDLDVQNYISNFLLQIKPFLRKQRLDQIALVISMNNRSTYYLRRYLIEFHPIIVDRSSNTIHTNGNLLLNELDSIFNQCLIELMRQSPIYPSNEDEDENEQISWKLQLRLCHHDNQKFEPEDSFYEQFRMLDNAQTSMVIRQLKSVCTQRVHIQLMCQDRTEKE